MTSTFMDERRFVSAPISYLKDVVLVNVLVTDDAGFIGPAVIFYVISLAADSVAEVSQRFHYVFDRVDICHRDQIEHVSREQHPDTILHLSESYVDRSISGPSIFLQANSMGTYTLREAKRHCWAALGDVRKDRCGSNISLPRTGQDLKRSLALLGFDHSCAAHSRGMMFSIYKDMSYAG
ncbi:MULTISPECIES: GDP-mannose 4,6-dehydratase [Pseudomonas]|uniref:GDP-mannose 4,6-dehydratase n=1 Tax=Pseudomonas TaxID=286 RepID=UPI0029583ACF|nr:GDP-mannose 4,6-dehydratase [Pseudomonas sp. A-RE-23]